MNARLRPSLQPLIIGHRGASAIAPENTLASFERAFADGADGIEFDVRLASDRVPVVIHDATLHRTARRNGVVAKLTSTELSQIDVGTWFNLRRPALAHTDYAKERIPTLAQVFEMAKEGDATLYVEMKCNLLESAALAEEIARLVRSFQFYKRVVVESFTLAAIAEIKRLDSRILTSALFEPKLTRLRPSALKLVAQAQRFGADELALHRSLATRRAVAVARESNLRTVVWTVDNPAWAKRAVEFGIHALITNKPALMRARLDGLLSDSAPRD